MKIIKITSLLKKRIKIMILDLLPGYGYIRVTNQGIVVLKKKWWSFKRTTVNVTDLFINTFPKKIAESCKRKGYGDTYERIFNEDIHMIFQLRAYKKDFDIVNYIWDKYNTLHREIPTIHIVKETFTLENAKSTYLPVLSPTSSYFIPGIEKLLKKRKKNNSIEKIIEKISKIQTRSPQFLIRMPALAAA